MVKNKSISLKFYCIDPQNGRLVAWLQTKNCENSIQTLKPLHIMWILDRMNLYLKKKNTEITIDDLRRQLCYGKMYGTGP